MPDPRKEVLGLALSAVARGAAYERVVARRFAAWGARLQLSGGAFDQGVDLGGSWPLPWPATPPWPGDRVLLSCVAPRTLKVPCVVQCKATSSPLGVGPLRELQHAIAARFPEGALVCVACTSGFALRSLARERSWALRSTLLLTISEEGALLGATALHSARGSHDALPSFVVTPCVESRIVVGAAVAPELEPALL